MAVSNITDEFQSDINITRAKYTEFIKTEEKYRSLTRVLEAVQKEEKDLSNKDITIILIMLGKTDMIFNNKDEELRQQEIKPTDNVYIDC